MTKVRSLTTGHELLYDGKPLKRISHTFKTTLKDASIKDVRLHDFWYGASTNLRRAEGDTATAMPIVGYDSEKMWKRYNAMEESDLLNAASKLNSYLHTNIVITPVSSDEATGSITA